MNFTLIGFGEVGSLVAALINTNYSCARINVMNTQTSKSGRILDLEHAAACRNNEVYHNSKKELENADFIIYSAGYSNAHGESRNAVVNKNKKLVFSIFQDLHFKNNPQILVITNPVEPISYWIQQVVGKQVRVLGTGTSLDTFRLKYILAKKFQCSTMDVECFVIGEHGKHMVPIYSHTKIKGQDITELCNQTEFQLITEELLQSAFQIRETEKATKYGIAESTLHLLQRLIQNDSSYFTASGDELGEWRNHYIFNQALFVSLPYKFENGNLKTHYLELNSDEKKAFQQAIDSISAQLTE